MDSEVSPEYKKTLVSSQKCFKVLNDKEISELAELFTEVRFKAGDVIVTEGDIVDSVFIIVTGKAEVQNVWVEHGALRADKLADLGPEDPIGLSDTGLYSLSGLRTATVVALTDMLTLRMSVTVFNGFVLSHSNVAKVLHAAAAGQE